MKQKFSIIFALAVGSIVILSLNRVHSAQVNVTMEELLVVKDYCLANVDKILAGGNPIVDLNKAGLTKIDGTVNCSQIDGYIAELEKKIFWDKLHEDSVRDLGRALDID
jgi:hypothetical protein